MSLQYSKRFMLQGEGRSGLGTCSGPHCCFYRKEQTLTRNVVCLFPHLKRVANINYRFCDAKPCAFFPIDRRDCREGTHSLPVRGTGLTETKCGWLICLLQLRCQSVTMRHIFCHNSVNFFAEWLQRRHFGNLTTVPMLCSA